MKVFVSISGKADKEYAQSLLSYLKEFKYLEVVTYERNGGYNPKPMLDCNFTIFVPPAQAFDSPNEVHIGKGQYTELIEIANNSKRSFIVKHTYDNPFILQSWISVKLLNKDNWTEKFALVKLKPEHRTLRAILSGYPNPNEHTAYKEDVLSENMMLLLIK